MNDNRQTTNSPDETKAAGDDRDVLAELVRAAGRRPPTSGGQWTELASSW